MSLFNLSSFLTTLNNPSLATVLNDGLKIKVFNLQADQVRPSVHFFHLPQAAQEKHPLMGHLGVPAVLGVQEVLVGPDKRRPKRSVTFTKLTHISLPN